MLKRIFTLLVIAIFILAAFPGCSAQKSEDAAGRAVAPSYAYSKVQDAKGSSKSDYGVVEETAASAASIAHRNEATGESFKKLIKNGEIAIEVKDVDEAYAAVMEILDELGGEEFSKSYNATDNYKRIRLVLKIPPENLDAFQEKLAQLVGSGKIKSTEIRSEDITSQYYDLQARLDSYKASRDQLRELLKKASNVEETLKIHAEITRLQADIDSMEGQIRMWDKLVSMATITLYIDEETDPMRRTTTIGFRFSSAADVWRTMKNGFVRVVNSLYSILVWMLVIIVSISPVIAIAAVVFFVVRYLRKRKKKKKETA